MDTPTQPADKPRPPRRTAASYLRLAFRALLLGLLVACAGEPGQIFVGANFHSVTPGQFYRSSQPSPDRLAHLIRAHGIRTVVNLRGSCAAFDWYLQECRASAELDVCQEDLCFSAGRLPAVTEIRRLVEVLDRSERPLLFHCQRGADRTGLASAVALLLYADVSYEEARRQLSLRYGHVAIGRPANLDRFFDLYQAWLQREGLPHSRATFRRWVEVAYAGGPCRATIEPLELPQTVRAGIPFGVRLRFCNTSEDTWHLRPEGRCGIHAWFVVVNQHAQGLVGGRAGFFDADVPPGQFIDLTLPVPAVLLSGRSTLSVDMLEEGHCFFSQVGSEPWEWEFDVHAPDAAAGG